MNSRGVKVLKVLGIGLGVGVAVVGLLFWGYQNSARTRLEKMRNTLRGDGLPITASEMRLPSPPVEENAAPLYVQLDQLLQVHPLTGNDKILDYGTDNFYETPAGLAQLRAAVRNRQDILQLVHQAAARPQCAFNRDYALGPNLLLPEYAQMRAGMRALVSESAELVAEGRPVDAVHNLEAGFHIAHHLDTEPVLIGQLVDIAIDAITLHGMGNILHKAGDRPEVADAVADAIARNWKPANVAISMQGEVVLAEVSCNMIRRDPAQLAAIMGMIDPDQIPAEQQRQANLCRLFGPLFTATLMDANECNYLDYEHRVYLALKRPYLDGKADLNALSKELEANSKRPTYLLASVLTPVFSLLTNKQAQDEARALTTRSSALVLAYKARHGKFPERLEEAVSPVPIDPLNGQPLHYRLYTGSDGVRGFEIYSAGNDGKFDGGSPTEKPKEYQTTFWYPMAPYQTKAIDEQTANNHVRDASAQGKSEGSN